MDLSGNRAEHLLTALVIAVLLIGALLLFPGVWVDNAPTIELTLEESAASVPIDLNTATKEQLMTLDGIGETKAAAIIAYRTEHGAFAEVSDAAAVKGISKAMTERWRKEHLVVCKEEFS